MAEGDILETPRVPPSEPQRPRKIQCEFCECELGSSGEYKHLSDKAKKFRALAETNEKLEERIVALQQEITDLKSRQPATPAPAEPERRGGIAL